MLGSKTSERNKTSRRNGVCHAGAARGEYGDVEEEGGGRSRMLVEVDEPGRSGNTDDPCSNAARRLLRVGVIRVNKLRQQEIAGLC